MRFRPSVLILLFLVSAFSAEAQERQIRDFHFTLDTTLALQMGNPAALSSWKGHVSMAEVTGKKENGALIPVEGSPDCVSILAGTESFYRISDRVVFHGKLSWSDFIGKEMGGQVLMAPAFHPVNFLESDENTTGVKKREMYQLVGDVSFQLGERWSVGFGIDYGAGDQTKVKDPRFSDIRMDMDLKAGMAFHPSPDLLLGLVLQYRNVMDQVRGGVYGTTDQQYYVDTDKGGFFGIVEILSGDNNYMPASSYRPMDNRFYGIALQALVKQRFSYELRFRYRDGYYGKKATSSPVFFEFSGLEAEYEGVLLLGTSLDRHRVRGSASFAMLGNDENLLRYVTPAGQSTQVEYTGRNHILDRTDLDAALDYRWYHGLAGIRPEMTLGASASFFSRTQTTTIYPYYRNHNYRNVRADLSGQRVFTSAKSSFILDLAAEFNTGWGVEKEDGMLASSTSTNLKSFDNYLSRQFEYETATHLGGIISFTFARTMKGGFEPYLKLTDRFVSLLSEPQYLQGRFRNEACIVLGCNF